MRGNRSSILAVVLCIMPLATSAAAAEKADYVFKNGAVCTIESKNPKAEAVAVTGKKISYVGGNREINTFVGKNTKIIDLKGKMPPENERITLDQALKAYTLDAVYVLGLEDRIGSLQRANWRIPWYSKGICTEFRRARSAPRK